MKKIYQKPEMRAIEIKSEQILLTVSNGPGVGDENGNTELATDAYWD